jgi:hypothetical protein
MRFTATLYSAASVASLIIMRSSAALPTDPSSGEGWRMHLLPQVQQLFLLCDPYAEPPGLGYRSHEDSTQNPSSRRTRACDLGRAGSCQTRPLKGMTPMLL